MLRIEIPQLTGLRFIAAFSILVLHAIHWCIPFTDTQVPIVIANWVGVYGMTLFFVLSGFVIHYNYASSFRDQSYGAASRTFYVARFARIYPLYFFFFVFGSLAAFTSNWISYAPREFSNYFWHSLTLTQSWVYEIAIQDKLVLDHGFGLAWSLSTEFMFYLAYGVFVFLILRIRTARAGLASVVLFSIAAFGVLLLTWANFAPILGLARELFPEATAAGERNWGASFFRWLFYFSPYGRIWEFVLGCLTAQLFLLVQNRPVSQRERLVANVVCVVAVVYLLAYGGFYAMNAPAKDAMGRPDGTLLVKLVHFLALNFGCAVPIAVVTFHSARYKTVLSGFLALPAIVWLGEISYSIYAVHAWTLYPLIRPPMSVNTVYEIDAVLRVSVGIAFTILVSAGTYMLIEQPSRRYLRALLMAKSPSGALPAARRG